MSGRPPSIWFCAARSMIAADGRDVGDLRKVCSKTYLSTAPGTELLAGTLGSSTLTFMAMMKMGRCVRYGDMLVLVVSFGVGTASDGVAG